MDIQKTYFPTRYAFYTYNNIFATDINGSAIIQYRNDEKGYRYNGKHLLEDYDHIFSKKGELQSLLLENGNISINGFETAYDEWKETKEIEFIKRINEVSKYNITNPSTIVNQKKCSVNTRFKTFKNRSWQDEYYDYYDYEEANIKRITQKCKILLEKYKK